jgi:Ni,Fe-hydrogenase I cytochrome b subunit
MLPDELPGRTLNAEARRVFRWGAVAMAVMALVPGYYALTLRWIPSADFDVTGMLFLMQNTPRLTAFVMTFIFVGAALAFLIRSFGWK